MSLPTFSPPYPPTVSENTPEVKILEAEFGDGYSQETGDGLNNVRSVVRLTWEVLTPAEAKSILDFFKEQRGYGRFWYQLSDDATPTKWSCKEWSHTRGTPNTVTATFRQQFDLGT